MAKHQPHFVNPYHGHRFTSYLNQKSTQLQSFVSILTKEPDLRLSEEIQGLVAFLKGVKIFKESEISVSDLAKLAV